MDIVFYKFDLPVKGSWQVKVILYVYNSFYFMINIYQNK